MSLKAVCHPEVWLCWLPDKWIWLVYKLILAFLFSLVKLTAQGRPERLSGHREMSRYSRCAVLRWIFYLFMHFIDITKYFNVSLKKNLICTFLNLRLLMQFKWWQSNQNTFTFTYKSLDYGSELIVVCVPKSITVNWQLTLQVNHVIDPDQDQTLSPFKVVGFFLKFFGGLLCPYFDRTAEELDRK